MLKKFCVKNFKNFNDNFCIDLSDVHDYKFNTQCIRNELLNKVIVYGKNAVGKTNLGFALFDLTTHLIDGHRIEAVYQDYLNADSDEKYASFSYEFLFEGDSVIYNYQKTDADTLRFEEFIFNGSTIFTYDFENNTWNFDGLKYLQIDSLNWQFKDNKMSILKYIANNTYMYEGSPILKVITFVSRMIWFRSLGNNIYIGRQIDNSSILSYITKNNLVDELNEYLQGFGIEKKIVSIKQSDGEDVVYFDHKRPIAFTKAASNGTISLTAFFFWLKQREEFSFIWIDEFDGFLHFEASEWFVKYLQKNVQSSQIVLTTHNTSLLSNKIMRPDCFFILTKNRITSLCNATDRELREGHNLEKLYRNGEFDVEE